MRCNVMPPAPPKVALQDETGALTYGELPIEITRC